MGELTGEQVAAYGADDAYWAVRVYKELMKRMLAENTAALVTFLKTENPMVRHYANMWRDGLRLDLDKVYERPGIDRANMAAVIRQFTDQHKTLHTLPAGKKETTDNYENWYTKNGEQNSNTH